MYNKLEYFIFLSDFYFIYLCMNILNKTAEKSKMKLFLGVRLQWDSNRTPGVRRGVAAAGGPARKYMPVANKVRSGQT